jgi:hypothetical protein
MPEMRKYPGTSKNLSKEKENLKNNEFGDF